MFMLRFINSNNIDSEMMYDDDEENWYFDSIKRYNQFHMFETTNVIRHMSMSDVDSVCVVGCNEKSGKDEILEYSLPGKVTVSEEMRGLTKDCNLSTVKGGFAKSRVFQMETLPTAEKLVASEEDLAGINVYDLSSASDLISVHHFYTSNHKSPSFSIKKNETILMASNSLQPIEVMDLRNGNIIQKIDVDQYCDGSIEAKFISENLVAVCHKTSGKITIKDMRSDCTSPQLKEASFTLDGHLPAENIPSLWTFSKTDQDIADISSSFSCVSTNQVFVSYDLRFSKAPQMISFLDLKTTNRPKLNISSRYSTDSGLLSFSGFDENVYIKRINQDNNLEDVFIHDAHKFGDGVGDVNSVTCHMWYRGHILLSAALDKRLFCGEFVPL